MAVKNLKPQKSIALINDISGFGRCSVTVQLPIISMLGVQCSVMPTSIFSNHSDFDEFYYTDYTRHMRPYMDHWEHVGASFQGICSGFLGSAEQIEIVTEFIHRFKKKDTIVIVEPVMGDYGRPYVTYTQDMCDNMIHLVKHADIVTPNVTEACILTGTVYKERFHTRELLQMAEQIAQSGPSKVVITGIPQKTYVSNLCYEKDGAYTMIKTHKVGTSRPGTGDVFSAIIAADAVLGVDFATSVRKASQFVKRCIARSIEQEVPTTNGVCFEELLYTLKRS